ncbi:unnamed protein product [Protopolystoma xenopodis]|uniref:Uncharacterized protein n=1 Tax=Protopolystoma xenopodis TaxID=117903 RepID=A0A3S5AX86_9PLAT|nr:unnamed protein product [Protopolystoma xenopodis]
MAWRQTLCVPCCLFSLQLHFITPRLHVRIHTHTHIQHTLVHTVTGRTCLHNERVYFSGRCFLFFNVGCQAARSFILPKSSQAGTHLQMRYYLLPWESDRSAEASALVSGESPFVAPACPVWSVWLVHVFPSPPVLDLKARRPS